VLTRPDAHSVIQSGREVKATPFDCRTDDSVAYSRFGPKPHMPDGGVISELRNDKVSGSIVIEVDCVDTIRSDELMGLSINDLRINWLRQRQNSNPSGACRKSIRIELAMQRFREPGTLPCCALHPWLLL
jgi:hypothetical protein